VGAAVRTAIAFADEQGDAATADVMTEIARGLDKQLWYLEAHLADRPGRNEGIAGPG